MRDKVDETAKFETMASLAAAHPMMGADKPFTIYHRAFCYWCSQYNGNEYVCWAAIQQYQHAPNKRKAIFIVDTWLRDTQGGTVDSRSMSILEPVNTGSTGGALKVETRKAIVQKISELKTVKTWTGKLANWSNRAKLGAVQADLLDAMGKNCDETLTGEKLARRVVDTEKDILGSAVYAVSLRTDIATLTTIGFDTKAMGVW